MIEWALSLNSDLLCCFLQCAACGKTAYATEQIVADDKVRCRGQKGSRWTRSEFRIASGPFKFHTLTHYRFISLPRSPLVNLGLPQERMLQVHPLPEELEPWKLRWNGRCLLLQGTIFSCFMPSNLSFSTHSPLQKMLIELIDHNE